MAELSLLQSALFGKYFVVLVLVVSSAFLVSGFVGMYFSYLENERAVMELQREKALSAGSRIEQFVRDIEQQIHWVVTGAPPPRALETGPAADEIRKTDYRRLLREALAITEVRYLDPAGREEVLVSRLGIDIVGSGIDYSNEPIFQQTRGGQTYFSPVYLPEPV